MRAISVFFYIHFELPDSLPISYKLITSVLARVEWGMNICRNESKIISNTGLGEKLVVKVECLAVRHESYA